MSDSVNSSSGGAGGSAIGTSAVAGITVGGAVVLAAVLLVGWLCWRRRERERRKQPPRPRVGDPILIADGENPMRQSRDRLPTREVLPPPLPVSARRVKTEFSQTHADPVEAGAVGGANPLAVAAVGRSAAGQDTAARHQRSSSAQGESPRAVALRSFGGQNPLHASRTRGVTSPDGRTGSGARARAALAAYGSVARFHVSGSAGPPVPLASDTATAGDPQADDLLTMSSNPMHKQSAAEEV